MQPLVVARVVVNFTSAVIPILVSNISFELVTIPNGKVIADETALKTRRVDTQYLSAPKTCVAILSNSNAGSTTSADPVTDAMRTADKALVSEQQVLLERLLRKHFTAFAAGPTDIGRRSLIYHRIEIGDSGLVRQPMRRFPHKHISVLRSEIDKLKKEGAVMPSSSPFGSKTILVKK